MPAWLAPAVELPQKCSAKTAASQAELLQPCRARQQAQRQQYWVRLLLLLLPLLAALLTTAGWSVRQQS